ncbi:MAG: HlyC/CorC family transporter [Chloroflexia bacterium]|nr:HlyC/CorC family transporter [Chloroflexia bacterium]
MELVVVLLLVLINGVLAASELAVVSSRRARLQPRADAGDAGAKAALALTEAPDRFLATVQIGITLVGILAGAFGGAALTTQLAAVIRRLEPLAPYANALAAVAVVGLITYLSLVVGELVPKRLALLNPEGVASLIARPMTLLAKVGAPAVWLLTVSSNLVLRLIGGRPGDESPVTEEDVEHLLQEGTRHGVFAESERAMVQGVFDLGDRNAGELMTPRRRMVALDLQSSDAENRARVAETSFAIFPVVDGSPDRVVGLVTVRSLWGRNRDDTPLDLASAMEPPLFVPESAPVLRVLEQFRRTRTHLAVVVDEYGGVEGLLTMEDVLAAIAGDLDAAGGGDAEGAVRRADGSWLLDGALPAHEVREVLGIAVLPGEEEGEFETLGGFVMAQLGHIPVEGEATATGGWRFEVVDMDGHRVDKVLAAPESAEPPPAD